ncbi:MAG: Protease HtpX [Verrucomicrobia subdivision 3 bacterium]|nr:Protease HtpX [Limisphaerales bacterium]MCS1414388.1 Protease HtpX [Limisphaerales bacterium]
MALVVLKSLGEFFLDRLNAGYVRERSGKIPDVFQGMMTEEIYAKSVAYTLAKNRLSQCSNPYDLAVLLAVLFAGFLPWSYGAFVAVAGESVWAAATHIIGVSLVLSVLGLPWEWHEQFRLEERFGFNKTSLGLWILDRVKGAALALLIGVPVIALLLKLVMIGGSWWWICGWVTVIGFQVVMMIATPMWILPLFNKFEPLADGELRDRLLKLGEATGFSTATIQVMDGSKRSAHANAFFTGFGQFRKIVLFDTLIDQLSVDELEAVLAHEIGHYKKRHVLKMLVWSGAALLVSFWVLAQLIRYPPFFAAFGFAEGSLGPAFLLFGLLSGAVTFWATPISSAWSRKFEYEADAFAAQAVGGADALVGALRKLSEKNLSNLTPHPLYSCFYYSHPTLLERERALRLNDE